ncbi:hypothetical protein [uncultured Megasphaera sp.]|uniref:hypothetical protein n=1 Tax=uncultured Megasphaera sp. TaxID=165188 RepID=UPI00258A3253|nr:hypothetical protein [uncultured Megasphaera sp.]
MLRTTIETQQQTLTELAAKLQTLSASSTKQQTALTELQQELESSKAATAATKSSLTTAQDSLQTANDSLTRQSESLQTLTRQINDESHKYIVAKRQRNAWAVLCGALMVYAMTK